MNITSTPRLLIKALILFTALLPAACAGGNHGRMDAASYTPQVYDQNYPIKIKAQRVVSEFITTRGLSTQDAGEAARFFAVGYAARANDLVIAVPPGVNQAAAAQLRDIAVAQGFSAEEIRIVPAQSRLLSASYTQPVAMTRNCGLWTSDSSVNSENDLPPEFGCSTQQNIAAMATNPLDLARPRYMPPHRMVLPVAAAASGSSGQ